MEPRFTVHSQYDEQEAIRFNRALLFNVWHLKKTIIVSNIALLVMLVTSFMSTPMKKYQLNTAMAKMRLMANI